MIQQRWLSNAGVIVIIVIVDAVLAWWSASLWLGWGDGTGGWWVLSLDDGGHGHQGGHHQPMLGMGVVMSSPSTVGGIERWWSAQGLACRKEGSVGNLSSLASYFVLVYTCR